MIAQLNEADKLSHNQMLHLSVFIVFCRCLLGMIKVKQVRKKNSKNNNFAMLFKQGVASYYFKCGAFHTSFARSPLHASALEQLHTLLSHLQCINLKGFE